MKKVKLAKIATAIMAAGVVSAPASALANEAQVAQASAEKTEVVAETEAAAEVTEEAPAAEEVVTPEVTEEVVTPVAPVEEVTPEAPAVAETTKPEVVAPKTEEATAPKVEAKKEAKKEDRRVDPEAEAELKAAKEAAYDDLEEMASLGYFSYETAYGWQYFVSVATTVAQIDAILDDAQGGKNPADYTAPVIREELNQAKEEAFNNIQQLLDLGYITDDQHTELFVAIGAATTVEKVNTIVNAIEINEVSELDRAKAEAIAILDTLLANSDISEDYHGDLVAWVSVAESVEEIDFILDNVVIGEYKSELERAKEEAHAVINELLANDDISEEYRDELAAWISVAESVEEIDFILDGIVVGEHKSELDKAKIAAMATLEELLVNDDISVDYYNELVAWVSVAESVEEIDFILEGIVIGAHKSDLEKAKTEAFATIGELLANDDISVEYYGELAEWITAAESVEEIDFILEGIVIGAHKSDLEKAKVAAFETIGQLLANDDISVEYYNELTAWISAAESVEEIDFILDGIVIGAHKSDLEKARAEAYITIGKLLADDDISVEYYTELAAWISLAESVEEIDFILDGIVIGAHKSDLEKAKVEAFEIIGDLLANEYISVAYYSELARAITAATTVEEVEAILNGIVIDELVLDTTDLEALIAEGKTYNEAWFTPGSWSVFAVALNDAEEFLASTQNRTLHLITQAEVNAQVAALEAAINQLEELPHGVLNLDELLATIKTGKGLVETKYTKDSWSVFAAALDHAELFVASTYARFDAVTQADVDAETAALKAAIAQLVEVKPETPITPPVKPVTPPVTPINIVKKDNKKVVVTKEAELPQTGEKENALLAVYGLTMAALAGLFISKRKKEENI